MARIVVLVILALAAPVLSAQSDIKQRGSIPLGSARDGSRPADGAIVGGSLHDLRSSPAPQRDIKRCEELAGQLRNDCLRTLGAESFAQPVGQKETQTATWRESSV